MDEIVIKYFNRELDSDSELALLKKLDEDSSLKRQVIDMQNLIALSAFSSANIKEDLGERSYTSFMNRLKRKKFNSYLYATMKYAAVAVLFIFLTYWFTSSNHVSCGENAKLNTLYVPQGQRARITLQDGSQVWLNACSKLTYPSQFSNEERRVRLEGEAFFEVAKNKKVPFIVQTDKLIMRVLGTKFNVYSYSNVGYEQACLLEGSLQVYPLNHRPESGVILTPHQQVTVRSNKMVVDEIKYMDVFLWKDGIYSFTDERFIDITNKLEQYYGLKIYIEDKDLANMKYTGKFRQNDGIDKILRMMQAIYPFNIWIDKGHQVIHLKLK